MIRVVNIKHHVPTDHDFYCGRGSPLGNPFTISHRQTREEVIQKYAEYLPQKIQEGHAEIRAELNRIWRVAKNGDVNLVCFCAPRACHADLIKHIIEEKLNGTETR